ncbi:MAG: ABC transporter substrate-binding protein [Lachnospiraceae bacterium]
MKKLLSLGIAATMATTLLTGCGSKPAASTDSGTTGTTTETTMADSETGQSDGAASGDPIRIGGIAAVTGDKAEMGESFWRSWQLAIDQVNAAGGVLGRPVELVLEDSKADPKEAVELTKKMGDDDSIVAVLGPMTSSEAIACAPVFEEYNMVELSPCASNNQYAPMSDYAFTVAGKMDAEMPYLVERGVHEYLEAKSIGVIWVNDDWGASAYKSTEEGCALYDIEITDAESFVSGEKDFTAILTKIRQTNPDYLMLVTQATDGALILNQVKAMGWDIPIIGAGAMYSNQVILLAGDAAENLVASAAFFLSEEDSVAWDYATQFYDGAGFYPTIHGPLSYDATLLLCAAIEKAGTTDRQAIRDALAVTTDQDVTGLLAGPYTFTEDGDIIRAYCLVKVQDGKWSRVSEYTKCSTFE